jgi:Ser/Thr protein kinase RdoA (MazF antagonist)
VIPILSAAEHELVEALLAAAWGSPVEVHDAEMVWGRRHVVRVHTSGGRSAIVKRPRARRDGSGESDREAFGVELASVEYLNAMPVAVAPRLLGADAAVRVLVMEELPAGVSLAESLLQGDEVTARADLIAYAAGLAAVHSWSIGRTEDFERARARHSPMADPRSRWLTTLATGRDRFLQAATDLGLPTGSVEDDIDDVAAVLAGSYVGFVHGDPCPDNVRLVGGGCRIFDFEVSSIGSVALDAAYLLAPFPSCWCFSRLPADVSGPALSAYQDTLAASGRRLGEEWESALAAALGCWVIARGGDMIRALEQDRQWGTTTMRPRLLAWTASFAALANQTQAFPRLGHLVEALHETLASAWSDTVIPDYPALAGPTASRAQVPESWQPGL